MPQGTPTLIPLARVTLGTPKKVEPGVIFVSESNEERIITDTPSGSSSGYEGTSSFEEATGSKFSHSTGPNKVAASCSGSRGAPIPDVPANHAMYDEGQNSESSAISQHEVPAPIAHDPNRWRADG